MEHPSVEPPRRRASRPASRPTGRRVCEGFGRPGTRVIPCEHVTVVLDDADGLWFSVGDDHPGYQSGPVGLAMWIALRQNNGRMLEAARTLAAPWGMRLEEVLAELHSWIGQLRAAGLVRTVR